MIETNRLVGMYQKVMSSQMDDMNNDAINKIANDYFNGGGHTNAAGGISSESLPETIEKLIVILKEELPNSNGQSDD